MVDMDYVKSLSRKELEDCAAKYMNIYSEFGKALHTLPELPEPIALKILIHAAMNWGGDSLWERGKHMQRDGLDVPFKAEYECAAGLWQIIRDSLLAEKRKTDSTTTGGSNHEENTCSNLSHHQHLCTGCNIQHNLCNRDQFNRA